MSYPQHKLLYHLWAIHSFPSCQALPDKLMRKLPLGLLNSAFLASLLSIYSSWSHYLMPLWTIYPIPLRGKKKYSNIFLHFFYASLSTMPSSFWTDDLPSYFTEKAEAIWYNLHHLSSSPSVTMLDSLKLSLISSSFLLFPPVSISFPKEVLGF